MSSWNDWAQDRRLQEAEASLADERRARSRLAEQMQEAQGNLQSQINRLTQALVALIEHEDIRGELSQFADAGAVRRYAREIVSSVVVTGSGVARGIAEPVDVPDYWLAAAVRGLARSASDPADSEALLAEAGRRDPLRTAALLTLLDCQVRSVRWSTGHLERVLPRTAEITHLQRMVWLAIADGRLDAVAEKTLRATLTAILPAESLVDAAICRYLPDPSRRRHNEDSAVAVTAAAALTRIEAWTTGRPDGVNERSAEASEDPIADCIRALVDEGSPGESDILSRLKAAREMMGFDTLDTTSIAPDQPVGDLLDLLTADLAGQSGAGAQRFAVAILAPILRVITDRLERDANAPAPDVEAVRVGSDEIRVTTEGTDADWNGAIQRYVAATTPAVNGYRYGAIGSSILLVLSLGLMAVSPGFVLMALISAAATVGIGVKSLQVTRDQRERTTALANRARREIDSSQARLVLGRKQRDAALPEAHRIADAIRAAL